MIYLCVILGIIVIVLFVLLQRKQTLDRNAIVTLNNEISQKKTQRDNLVAEIDNNILTISKLQANIQQLKNDRFKDIEEAAELRRKTISYEIAQAKQNAEEKIAFVEQKTQKAIEEAEIQQKQLQYQLTLKQEEYNSLIQPFKNIEKEKQDRLFFTIQTPEEYRDDINYLLNITAAKINHPDIINKLIWQEYMKPYFDDTCKRLDIKAEPGIYKLTSLIDNKCYVGKSTNVKKRIQDHFKSAIGIDSIADQAVHHAILKEGFWNWTIEVLTYCSKDELSEKEKLYIDTFQGQTWGYNKKEGG